MEADRSIEAGPKNGSSNPPARSLRASILSPIALLLCAVVGCALLLTRSFTLPLGPMYWDLVLYLDAANRIAGGQVPLLDFLTPVGPLGYWLFAWLGDIFPKAQPLLLAQWSLLPVTAVPMALILREADMQSRSTAFGLLLPYLAFQILPINVEQYSFFPGVDGFGIYNRQASIVLYVLVSALVVLRSRRVLAGIVAWCLLALLLIKVTGFLAGGLVVAFALLAGRLDIRIGLLAAAMAGAALLVLELRGGIVSAYVASIVALLALNAGGILERFLRAGSLHLDIVVAGSALIVALVWLQRRDIASACRELARQRSWTALVRLFDRDGLWLAVTMAAGLFLETQNTGGQAFIFVWPVLLAIVTTWGGTRRPGAFVVLALVAATAIPPAASVLQRAGRTVLAQSGYIALPHTHLGRLGLVSQHPEVVGRAGKMQAIYASSVETYKAIADQAILPGQTLYSELDFQLGWLMAVDAGIAGILAHEAKTGERFETIMSLNFVNPFPALMGRTGVRRIAIGADPSRAVPKPDDAALAAVAAADLVVMPQCPVTVANETLLAVYAPALVGRREIALGACWKGFVKG